MFKATYKATLKTILRSAVIWAAIIIVIVMSARSGLKVHHGRVILDDNDNIVKEINDLDPEYTFDYRGYLQLIGNDVSSAMRFLVPVFTAICTMTVLTREHKDSLFEIEKAGGVKTLSYFFGRVLAVVTVCTAVAIAAIFTENIVYGAVRDILTKVELSPMRYIGETTGRIFLVFFTSGFHGLLFYAALSYFVGQLMKSGLSGCVAGCAYVLFLRAASYNVNFRMTYLYSLLSPAPSDINTYWMFFGDSDFLKNVFGYRAWGITEVILRTALVYAVVFLLFGAAYVCIKKRKV